MKTIYLSVLLGIAFQLNSNAQVFGRNSDTGCTPILTSENYMEGDEIKLVTIQSGSSTNDRLFLLNPGFKDARFEPQNQLYYCPFNAMMEGILTYYPDLKQKIEIYHVDFSRPRKMIIEILGEENQGLPLLIIGRRDVDLSSIKTVNYQGNIFIRGTDDITKYLALAYQIPLPHP